MLKAVLDTNVLVSAYLVPRGKPARILSLAKQGKLAICLSPPILSELKQTLLRPKLQKIHKATAREVERFITVLTRAVVMMTGTEEVHAVKDDPEDNKILACALEAGADFIVSGDHHLTDMKVFQDIPIVNPDIFLTSMTRRLRQLELSEEWTACCRNQFSLTARHDLTPTRQASFEAAESQRAEKDHREGSSLT